jgi:hypothetical protein
MWFPGEGLLIFGVFERDLFIPRSNAGSGGLEFQHELEKIFWGE